MAVLVGFCRGPSYESFKNDIRCVQLYFHERWRSPVSPEMEAEYQAASGADSVPESAVDTGLITETESVPKEADPLSKKETE